MRQAARTAGARIRSNLRSFEIDNSSSSDSSEAESDSASESKSEDEDDGDQTDSGEVEPGAVCSNYDHSSQERSRASKDTLVSPSSGQSPVHLSIRRSHTIVSSMRTSNGSARQNVRNGIVQQWDPSAAQTNGSARASNGAQAPLTPPINAEDETELARQDLEHKIQLQVEENGIERPKGHTVSFHYNRRVENMHFGRTHPMKPWRLTLTKHLVMAYGLQHAMDNYEALPASTETVATFHDPEYVDFLSRVSPQTFEELCRIYNSRTPISGPDDIVKLGPFNLSTSPGADCPVFDGMSEYLFLYTGATMEAVSSLINNQSDIAINWSGGLHHAHKSEASGFCYINDIVLAILELLKVHARVLYIDIDVHHGDGVEEAFASSDRVMTISFHRYGIVNEDKGFPGHLFFPGTGAVTDNGIPGSMGHHFALNVPIPSGICDEEYTTVFERIIGRTLESFRPQAIVLQCGADSLGGDRLGQFNLNIKAHGDCLAYVKRQGIPLLILGGGGYTARNVARAWCHETALAVDVSLAEDLPMHILPRPQAFQGRQHGDGKLYPELKGFHPNDCTRKDLEGIIERCYEELRYVEHAPSVVMERLPARATMEKLRRQVDDELEMDKAAEGGRGERERRRKERGTGVRGELR